jgi:hypothetical protein
LYEVWTTVEIVVVNWWAGTRIIENEDCGGWREVRWKMNGWGGRGGMGGKGRGRLRFATLEWPRPNLE